MPDQVLEPPEPALASDRIALRPFRDGDAAHVARSCQDPLITKFTFMSEGLTLLQAREWIANRNQRWPEGLASFAILRNGSDIPLGQVGALFDWTVKRAEVFYWLDSEARGQGLATEALNLVTDWIILKHNIVRVQLLTHPQNFASQRVAERCGFTREGVLRAWEPIKDERPDVVMWSRLNTDNQGAAHP